jgi:hypothetical protein
MKLLITVAFTVVAPAYVCWLVNRSRWDLLAVYSYAAFLGFIALLSWWWLWF